MISTRIALVVAVLSCAGCQTRLNDERTFPMDVGSIKSISISAPRYDQKVTVVMSADAEVTIAVYLAKDQKEVEDKLDKFAKPAAVLALKENVKSADFEVTVPGKQDAIVRIQSNKQATTVKLSLKGK